MTGAEIYEKWLIKLDEVGSDYVDTDRANSILSDANINVVDKKIQEYQATSKITREMMNLINNTGNITPSSATLDISPTSLVVPDYYQLVMLSVTAPFRGANIENVAQERKFDEFNSTYSAGDARYPKYYFTKDLLTIEPSTVVSAKMYYFKKPFQIDVTDVATQIDYNDKLIQLLLDEAMIILGIAGRDQAIIQNSTQQEIKNP